MASKRLLDILSKHAHTPLHKSNAVGIADLQMFHHHAAAVRTIAAAIAAAASLDKGQFKVNACVCPGRVTDDSVVSGPLNLSGNSFWLSLTHHVLATMITIRTRLVETENSEAPSPSLLYSTRQGK